MMMLHNHGIAYLPLVSVECSLAEMTLYTNNSVSFRHLCLCMPILSYTTLYEDIFANNLQRRLQWHLAEKLWHSL